jgi:hypothetical protein
MANKFELDLIANTEGFTAGLEEAQDELAALGLQAIKTGKETQKAFETNGGAEKFGKTLRDAVLFVGKTEIEIRRLKAAMKVAFDPKEAAALNAEFEALRNTVIKAEAAFANVESTAKGLKGEIRENKQILAEMEAQGLDTTNAFIQLQIVTGKLQDQVNDTNERIKFFASDTRGLDSAIALARGAAAGFAVAEGAAALFGAENENVQKALLKVNAAMAILNGLQEIQAALQKSSAARIAIETVLRKAKIFVIGEETVATNTLTVAQNASAIAAKALRAALLATGVGAVLFLVTQLISAISAMSDFSKETEKATDIIKEQDAALSDLSNKYKFLTDSQIADAKRLGANNETLRAIEKQGMKDQLDLLEKDMNDKIAIVENLDAQKLAIFRDGNNDERKEFTEQYKAAKEALKGALDNRTNLLREYTLFIKNSQTEANEEERAANEKFDKEQEEKLKDHLARMAAILDGNNANRIAAIQNERDRELAQLEENQRKELIAANKTGLDRKLLDAKFAKERTDLLLKFQKEDYDNIVAFNDLVEQLEKERDEEFFEDRMSAIDNLEKIKKIELDIEFESGTKSLAEAKRLSKLRLEVEIEAAEERIKVLKDSSQEGNEIAIRTAELSILEAKNKIDDLAKEGNNSAFLKAIGLGGVTPDQLQEIKNNYQIVVDSLKAMFNDLYDSAIATNRLTIDKLSEQIEQVKENVQEQQKLADEGRKNNLKAEQANLAKLENERRAALERDKKLQRQKLNIDTISQVSSLVTASAKIYESYASIPYIGQALAVAAIVAMFAAFAANQVSARQAINQQTLKHGGVVGGKYHNADGWGGNRFVSDNGDETYIEKDEYVVNRRATKRFRKLLDAINFERTNELRPMLAEMGISMSQDKVDDYKRLKSDHALSEIKYRVDLENKSGNKELREIKKEIESLRKDQNDKPNVTISDGWKIEIKGNRTIRTKLKNGR